MQRPSHAPVLTGIAAALMSVGAATAASPWMRLTVVPTDVLLPVIGFLCATRMSKRALPAFGLATWALWLALDVAVFKKPLASEVFEVAVLLGSGLAAGLVVRAGYERLNRRPA